MCIILYVYNTIYMCIILYSMGMEGVEWSGGVLFYISWVL
jgi:hypothetical protein